MSTNPSCEYTEMQTMEPRSGAKSPRLHVDHLPAGRVCVIEAQRPAQRQLTGRKRMKVDAERKRPIALWERLAMAGVSNACGAAVSGRHSCRCGGLGGLIDR